MQFIDLQRQYAALKSEIDAAIAKVLKKSDYILGQDVGDFEKSIAAFVGVKHCVSCANGTDALSIVFDAYKIGKGDAVFLPTFTFFATAETVSKCGATPIFIDADADTFNIDCIKLEQAVQKVKAEGGLNCKAVVAVDLFGLPADYVQLNQIAKKHDLLVIEDGAQGFGGAIGEQYCGSFGDVATTSFFPAKPLGCYGDGGAIFTNHDVMASRMLSLRFHGRGEDKYDNVQIGYNSRLDTVQAAVLKVKLEAFKSYELRKRREIAVSYDRALKDYVSVPLIPKGYASSYAQYTVKLESEEKRNRVMGRLKNKGIPSMIYYPKCMHQQTAYQGYRFNLEELKVAEILCKTVLALPMHPYLTEEEVDEISKAVINSL